MRSCKEITKLVSGSLDRPLTIRDRIEVMLHLKMCRLCHSFWRDVRRLRQTARDEVAVKEQDESIQLAPSSKVRIQATVDRQIDAS